MEAVHNTMSLNRKKIKATSSCNRLYNEYTRDEATADHYDDGHRMINTDKTADNILLADETGDVKLDAYRKHIIKGVNEARKSRKEVTADDAPKSKKTLEEREKWAKLSNSNRQRGLRKDTVDLIGNVIQLGNGALETLPEDQQILAYKAAFEVMKQHPEDYGKVLVASIHRDESSMHLQVMTSAIDENEMKSRAKEMFGNRSKMSDDQTKFVDRVQEDLKSKGLDFDINRGLKRVDNPEYTNFKDEMEAKGLEVNRYSDNQLLQSEEQVRANNAKVTNSQMEVSQNALQIESATNNMAFNAFDKVQETRGSNIRYNRFASMDIEDETLPADHFLCTEDDSPLPGHDDRNQAKAEEDVKRVNSILNGDRSNAFNRITDWGMDRISQYSALAISNIRVAKLEAKLELDNVKRRVLTTLHAEKWLPKTMTIDDVATGTKKVSVNHNELDDADLLEYTISHANKDDLRRYKDNATTRRNAKVNKQADDDLEL